MIAPVAIAVTAHREMQKQIVQATVPGSAEAARVGGPDSFLDRPGRRTLTRSYPEAIQACFGHAFDGVGQANHCEVGSSLVMRTRPCAVLSSRFVNAAPPCQTAMPVRGCASIGAVSSTEFGKFRSRPAP